MWRLTYRESRTFAIAAWGLLAVLGLLLALAGARVTPPENHPDETLVWVNDGFVTSAQLHYAEERRIAGGSLALSEAQRRSLLDLLIDEELLLQRAENLGVLQADPGVRKLIVQSAIRDIVEAFLAESVDPDQLQQFYGTHGAVFERAPRVAVAALRFDSLVLAQQARELATAGTDWEQLATSPGAQRLRHLPGSPLPAHALRSYLGPGPTGLAMSLAPGAISQPVEGAGGVYLLHVTASIPASRPEFDDIIPLVRQEYLSRGRELALAEKLAALWAAADIQFNSRVAVGHPDDYLVQATR